MSATAIATDRKVSLAGSALTLDDLADKTVEELSGVYSKGRTPKDMSVLNGRPQGRMLAMRALDEGFIFQLLGRIAAADIFLWGGKSFKNIGKTKGTGINRIKLGPLGRHNLFPFDTSIEKSVIDGKDCIFLQYDKPQNPWFIRKIRDEIREVSPGVFLGPAMWKTSDSEATFVLWFALDTNIQSDDF